MQPGDMQCLVADWAIVKSTSCAITLISFFPEGQVDFLNTENIHRI